MRPPPVQWGPSASWPVVFVPIAGPVTFLPVLIVTSPLAPIVAGWRSMPRGAGPAFFSPTRLYCEPWHWHSNHWLVVHCGTRQPRCGHFWLRIVMPWRIVTSSDSS